MRISIFVEEEIHTLPSTEKQIGIDLGLKSFLITSEGETIDNPKYYARYEKKLTKLERRKAKKKKGSKNRNKARVKVARLHAKIADTRRDFQHQLSTQLIRENQTICLETLSVKIWSRTTNSQRPLAMWDGVSSCVSLSIKRRGTDVLWSR